MNSSNILRGAKRRRDKTRALERDKAYFHFRTAPAAVLFSSFRREQRIETSQVAHSRLLTRVGQFHSE
jgi:hypothetical protein